MSELPRGPFGAILADPPWHELFARQQHPGQTVWGNETDKFAPIKNDYDAEDDFAKSIEFSYEHIRARKAAGGKGWREP